MMHHAFVPSGPRQALFLDRDGVINRRIVDGYVTTPQQFHLIDGVLEAMAIFATRFSRIVVVTNQQGIGKGLMSDDDLAAIHSSLLAQVDAAGGRIDAIYYCPSLKADHSFSRKPSIGMALQARHEFPDISLRNSVMVGDTATDMLFGRRARMTTVLVGDDPLLARSHHHLVDYCYPDLLSFARTL